MFTVQKIKFEDQGMPIASINPANGETVRTFEPLDMEQISEK
jgi:hypothetical protein